MTIKQVILLIVMAAGVGMIALIVTALFVSALPWIIASPAIYGAFTWFIGVATGYLIARSNP